MKTTTFVKATVFAAGLTLGASGLLAAPQAKEAEQSTRATQNWIEQHLKGKQGRYSGAEDARLQDAQNSTAYRAEAPAATSGLTAIEQRRKMKQGQ